MTRGLMSKSWRETRLATVGLGLAAAAVTGLITFVIPQLGLGLNDFILDVPFIRSMISAMTGLDISGGLTTTMMLSVLWTHPVVLAIVSAHAIILCARYPAGEVERGTIDVLLGWPVSRRAVWRVHSLVWLISGVLVVAAALAGYTLGTLGLPAEARPQVERVLMAAANLLALYIAVGGVTLLASAIATRQGHATAVGFAAVAGSFLLNFLVPYWAVADAVSFLGLMEYYRPALILRDGLFPIRDILVLTAIAAGLWCAGMEITARRDIVTT